MNLDDASYRTLADYGLIGDCRTAALVSSDGSIDWLCAPYFDSPALFARLLDVRRGGYFSIQPAGAFESRTEYIEESAVLRTTFRTPYGSATLTDFLALTAGEGGNALAVPRAARSLMRILKGVHGELAFLLDCRPRPDCGVRAAAITAAPGGVRIDEARRLFESLLARATPLGLFAEELDPAGGQRGNFPQALTLLALVNAALALDGRSALEPQQRLQR